MSRQIELGSQPGEISVYTYSDGVIGFATPAGHVFFDPTKPDTLRVVPRQAEHRVHQVTPTAHSSLNPGADRHQPVTTTFFGLTLKQVDREGHQT